MHPTIFNSAYLKKKKINGLTLISTTHVICHCNGRSVACMGGCLPLLSYNSHGPMQCMNNALRL